MKKSFLFLIICSFFLSGNLDATNFEPGDALTVFATSGLTLRMGPNQSAEAVIVIPFGDEVVVLNNFGFEQEKSAIRLLADRGYAPYHDRRGDC